MAQIKFIKTEKIKAISVKLLTEVNILPICKQQLQTDYRRHSVRFNKHQTDESSFYLSGGYKGIVYIVFRFFLPIKVIEFSFPMTRLIEEK